MRLSVGGLSRSFKAVLVVVSVLAVASLFVGQVSAASNDPSSNDIMTNGFSSPSNFISKVNADAPGDLQTIYSNYGLVPSMYDSFVSSAQSGTAYQDGRIVVAGQVVGHASQSIGRLPGNGNTQKVTIGGKTYWGGSNAAAFGSDSLPVTVLFNSQGVMQFAVLNNCGNPETFTAVTPSYSCDALHKSAVSGQPNTYNFTTSASAANNATVIHAVYNFGDGTTAVVNNLSTPVQHTFTGNATVRVRIYVKVPGSTVTATSVNCETQIVYQAPPPPPPVTPPVTPPAVKPYATCTNLAFNETDNGSATYQFTAQANYGGGAVFNSADFNFDSGSSNGVTMTGVIPNGTTAMISHSYGTAGTHTIIATLHFTNPDSSTTAVNCQATLTTQAPPSYCKPGVLSGSADCATQLIDTGPGGVAGIFGGVSVIGGLGHYLIRKRGLFR